jgi:hypothetical protein
MPATVDERNMAASRRSADTSEQRKPISRQAAEVLANAQLDSAVNGAAPKRENRPRGRGPLSFLGIEPHAA